FAQILSELQQTPPLTTRIVMAVGDGAREFWPAILAGLGIGIVAWHVWSSHGEGRRQWHSFLLALPVVGGARRSLSAGRAAGAMAALLESGVPMRQALVHAASASGDAAVGAALLRAREMIGDGASLSRALTQERALTPTTHRLVRAGE